MDSPLCSAPQTISTLSTTLFYTAALLSAATVPGHTKFGLDIVFPALKKAPQGPEVTAAKIVWMECNQPFVFLTLFCIKWANYGLTDTYDKVFLGLNIAAQIGTGIAYIKAGIYEPLLPLFGLPLLAGAAWLL